MESWVQSERVRVFDTAMMGLDGFTDVFLIEGEAPVLVDAGTVESGPRLVAWLRRHGIVPRYVVVTHAHHDHVGGIHAILSEFGDGVDVLASPVGVDRLRDPDLANRLYASDPIVPVLRARAVTDGEEVNTGDSFLRFHLTPGHSDDSLSVHDRASDTLFVGDLLGDWLWGETYLPPVASEDFDERAMLDSVRKLARVGARRLALSHGGMFDGEAASNLIGEQTERYERWREALVGAYLRRRNEEDVVACVKDFLAGSRFASLAHWEIVAGAFAAWCLVGYRNAGLVSDPKGVRGG